MFTEERMIVREGARYWWVFLLTGIAWLVLRLNETSLTTVGVLFGVSQVVQAADEPQEASWTRSAASARSPVRR
jgi:hypothetical protein